VVSREDKRRMSLYRKLGKADYDSSSLYHLVLNMARMDLQQALKLVCNLVES
jgi:cytidylate kinase